MIQCGLADGFVESLHAAERDTEQPFESIQSTDPEKLIFLDKAAFRRRKALDQVIAERLAKVTSEDAHAWFEHGYSRVYL